MDRGDFLSIINAIPSKKTKAIVNKHYLESIYKTKGTSGLKRFLNKVEVETDKEGWKFIQDKIK